jgi:hypothetical protein
MNPDMNHDALSPYRRLAQFPGVEEHRRRTGHAQARRYPRVALASKCLRVAVLPRGQGENDSIYAPDEGSHDGLQCQ